MFVTINTFHSLTLCLISLKISIEKSAGATSTVLTVTIRVTIQEELLLDVHLIKVTYSGYSTHM